MLPISFQPQTNVRRSWCICCVFFFIYIHIFYYSTTYNAYRYYNTNNVNITYEANYSKNETIIRLFAAYYLARKVILHCVLVSSEIPTIRKTINLRQLNWNFTSARILNCIKRRAVMKLRMICSRWLYVLAKRFDYIGNFYLIVTLHRSSWKKSELMLFGCIN